jgi:hypothetical protein
MAGGEDAGNLFGVRGSCDREGKAGALVGPADGAFAYGRARQQAFRTQDRKKML